LCKVDDLHSEIASFGHALEDRARIAHAYLERRNLGGQQVLDLA
jgi:hypothetical protein